MTANSNCGPDDTCETPSWTVGGNTSAVYLICNPCVSQTVYAEARSESYQDVQLTVDVVAKLDSKPFAEREAA